MAGLIHRADADGKNVTPVSTATPLPVALYAGDGSGELGSATDSVPVAGDVANAATDSGNPVKIGGKYSASPASVTSGQRRDVEMTADGSVRVRLTGTVEATATGRNSAVMGIVGGDHTTARGLWVVPYVYNGSTVDMVVKPNATSRIASAAASTNGTSAKASAGNLHTVHGYNAAAAVRYLKFYNKASAPTVGTDTPVITIAIGPSQAFRFDLGGHYFSTGIAYALTTGAADADTGALTAGDILGLTVSYA